MFARLKTAREWVRENVTGLLLASLLGPPVLYAAAIVLDSLLHGWALPFLKRYWEGYAFGLVLAYLLLDGCCQLLAWAWCCCFGTRPVAPLPDVDPTPPAL